MKRIKYGGKYKAEPGDILVYQKDGASVITERELRERKMPVVSVPWVSIKTKFSWNKNELMGEQNNMGVKKTDLNNLCKFIFGEKKMNNYFVLDGKQIPMSDETATSLREEQKTYSIGDCFRVGDFGTVVMLINFGTGLVGAACISINYVGTRWITPSKVEDIKKITKPELRRILNTAKYTPVTIKVEEVQ